MPSGAGFFVGINLFNQVWCVFNNVSVSVDCATGNANFLANLISRISLSASGTSSGSALRALSRLITTSVRLSLLRLLSNVLSPRFPKTRLLNSRQMPLRNILIVDMLPRIAADPSKLRPIGRPFTPIPKFFPFCHVAPLQGVWTPFSQFPNPLDIVTEVCQAWFAVDWSTSRSTWPRLGNAAGDEGESSTNLPMFEK